MMSSIRSVSYLVIQARFDVEVLQHFHDGHFSLDNGEPFSYTVPWPCSER